jgi:hypothetical protein
MTVYKARAPALPLPTVDYDQRQQDQVQYALRLYFNQLDSYNLATSIPASGVTADRPAQQLQVGQFYFDTTLGYPIWYDGTDWVDATGTVV